MKVEKATWTRASDACRLSVSGLVKRIQAYCKFEMAMVAMTPANSWTQRFTTRGSGVEILAAGTPTAAPPERLHFRSEKDRAWENGVVSAKCGCEPCARPARGIR